MGDHDGLFKRIFGLPVHSADLLRSVLPASLVAALDLTRLELLPGSFVSPSMAHRHSDLLFRVPLGDRLVYLHIIIEHQRIEDLIFVSDEDLLARPLAPVPQMALWLLRDGRNLTALLAHIAAWRAVFARVLADFPDEGRIFVRYILLTAGPHSYEAVRQAVLEHIPAAEAPLATIADQLRQEGLQQGLQQGRQEGLGVLRETLRVQLTQRFGALDTTYDARIDGADMPELQRLGQRVMLASELADVFATH